MKVSPLKPGDIENLKSFLSEFKESSLFLLANLVNASKPYSGNTGDSEYCIARKDGKIVATAAHTWLGSVLIQAPDGGIKELLQEALTQSGRPFEGALGPAAQVAEAVEVLALEKSDFRMFEVEGLYSVEISDMRIPEALSSGRVTGRRGQISDLDLLSRWYVEYGVETLGETRSETLLIEKREWSKRKIEDEVLWIVEEEGTPVATSLFNATVDDIAQIGGVWTPPENRGKGFARAAVAHSLIDSKARGFARSVLFTGDENIPAIKAYSSLGFERIGDYTVALTKAPLPNKEALSRLLNS